MLLARMFLHSGSALPNLPSGSGAEVLSNRLQDFRHEHQKSVPSACCDEDGLHGIMEP